MSQSANTTSRDASPALGSRKNFFETDEEDYADESEETLNGPRPQDVDRDWGVRHTFHHGTTKAEYVAHSLLKQSATVLCPVTLHAPPNRGKEPLFNFLFGDADELEHDPDALHTEREAVELSDPELHVPKEFPDGFAPDESVQYRLRRRYNDEYGYVSFGGKIANRPTDEFMEIVDSVLDYLVGRDDTALDRETADGIREGALHCKLDGEMDDVEIMEEVVVGDVLEVLGGGC